MSDMRAFRLVLASVVILVVLAAPPAYPWHGEGNITALAIDPLSPTTLYAGTSDRGVFKSVDGGATWTGTGLTNVWVTALAIDPQTPSTVYAGTRGGGVFKTADAGGAWTVINNGLTELNVSDLAVDPQTPATLYAVIRGADYRGTSGGVFKSMDEGATWNAVLRNESFWTTAVVQAVVINPQIPTTLYVHVFLATSEMEWVENVISTDGGTNWVEHYNLRVLAIDPKTSTTLYAVGTDATWWFSGTVSGLLKSMDGGATWIALNDSVGISTLAIDPVDPNILYAGTAGVYKSTDGGTTWSAINTGLTDFLSAYGVDPGIGPLAIDRVTPTTLYAGTSLGVFKSTDGGATWSPTGLFQHSPLISLSLSPTTVAGGAASTGTVTLVTAAPAGGITVALSSNNPSVATVPASVTVPAGDTGANFTVSTSGVAASTAVTISAAFDDLTRSAVLRVLAPSALVEVSLSSRSVAGGTTLTGTVHLSEPELASGAVVGLSSSDPAVAAVPASVTVPAGALYAHFTISTSSVAASTVVTISGTYNSVTKSAALTVMVLATSVSSLSLNPTSVTGEIPSYGTVTLNGAAPAGGITVTLSSSNPWVATVPVWVIVPTGTTSGTFTVGTKPVTASTAVTISASLNGVTKSAALTVTPPPVSFSSLSLNPASVTGGNASTGTVSLSAPAPAGGAAVALSSDTPTVATVPLSVAVAAGATSASFTVTTFACAPGSVTISGTYSGVTRSAQLTVTTTPDTVAIQTAEYFARRQVLRVEATSTGSTATLSVFESSSGQSIGTLTHYDGGKYHGQFRPLANPQNIGVRSSLCGSATSAVTTK